MRQLWKTALFTTVILAVAVSFAFADAAAVKSVVSKPDRANHLYKCGEEAKIELSALDANGKNLSDGHMLVVYTNDSRDTLKQETFDLSKANPVSVTVTMDKPGFMIARIVVTDATAKKNRVSGLCGLGFEPERIMPGKPEPKDFAEFWANGKKEVRAIPIDLKMTKLDKLSSAKIEVFAVSFATVNGQRVYGYLSKPVGKGPWPTLVNVPGAGPGIGPDGSGPNQGFVCLNMNVFPYETPVDAGERQAKYAAFTKGRHYPKIGMPDRDKMFFRPVYLGIDRAVDWLMTQPYVDTTRVGVYGSSQGGGSSLILAGMNKCFKYCVANVPAICDHNGLLQGRASGWPHFATSKDDTATLDAAAYMDAVYFASRINCPTKVLVGFIDVTCSPSSVYAAYNVIRGPKWMIEKTEMGHAGSPEYNAAVQWMKDELKK